jgi:hypothetical protein
MKIKNIDCPHCHKKYSSRKGLKYHLNNYHLAEQEILNEPEPVAFESLEESHNAISDSEPESIEVTQSDWMNPSASEDSNDANDATDFISHSYKNIAKGLTGNTQSATAVKEINMGLLMSFYGLVDIGLSKWANFATLGEINEVKHDHKSKQWTSECTYNWMKSEGWDLSTKVTPKMLMLLANGVYVSGPIHRINKKSSGDGILRKMKNAKRLKNSFIGRLFGKFRRNKQPKITDYDVNDYEMVRENEF